MKGYISNFDNENDVYSAYKLLLNEVLIGKYGNHEYVNEKVSKNRVLRSYVSILIEIMQRILYA